MVTNEVREIGKSQIIYRPLLAKVISKFSSKLDKAIG